MAQDEYTPGLPGPGEEARQTVSELDVVRTLPPPGAESNGQRVPVHLRAIDPNEPPDGTPTAKSRLGGPMPERGYVKRIIWLRLPPPYGYHVRAWVNAPTQLLEEAQRRLRKAKDPDDARLDTDVPGLALDDFAIDPEEYGIPEVERLARQEEIARRQREIDRRTAERERRRAAYDEAWEIFCRTLGEIIIEHTIPDMNGELLPPADAKAFWDFASGELQTVIFSTVFGQQGKLSPQSARR